MGLIRLTLLILTILASALAQAAETRIALVIGNSDYSSGSLPNPANDAKLIGDALTSLARGCATSPWIRSNSIRCP